MRKIYFPQESSINYGMILVTEKAAKKMVVL